MGRLSAADLRSALDFVAEAHTFEGLDEFRRGILPGLLALVPSDLVGYNEVDPGGGAPLVLTYPYQVPDEYSLELPRLAHEHPLICVQVNGELGTFKISDFLSSRQFHALELYDGLYGKIGAEDQIACGLDGPVVIGIAMNRDRRSFSERDREMLDLLRPHLAQAYGRARGRERAAALAAAVEGDLAGRGVALIRIAADGRIAEAGPLALRLLADYFPDGCGSALPGAIAAWLAGGGPRAEPHPLRVSSQAGSLTVSAAELGEGELLLTLEEVPAIVPERLGGLGLTRRQAQVLALLADGAEIGEVASSLYISVATVRKHLEHVYARLGVHRRSQAVELARRAARRQ